MLQYKDQGMVVGPALLLLLHQLSGSASAAAMEETIKPKYEDVYKSFRSELFANGMTVDNFKGQAAGLLRLLLLPQHARREGDPGPFGAVPTGIYPAQEGGAAGRRGRAGQGKSGTAPERHGAKPDADVWGGPEGFAGT